MNKGYVRDEGGASVLDELNQNWGNVVKNNRIERCGRRNFSELLSKFSRGYDLELKNYSPNIMQALYSIRFYAPGGKFITPVVIFAESSAYG